MPGTPWRKSRPPDSQKDYVALLSYLPLKSFGWLLPFIIYTLDVIRQLASTDGLAGYALLARPFSKRFWTLSAWESEEALQAFVRHPPHARIMARLARHMGPTSFTRWNVKGSELPLKWDDALRRAGLQWRRLTIYAAFNDHYGGTALESAKLLSEMLDRAIGKRKAEAARSAPAPA
jgi:Antibiotic biosynthesis monooxygenase